MIKNITIYGSKLLLIIMICFYYSCARKNNNNPDLIEKYICYYKVYKYEQYSEGKGEAESILPESYYASAIIDSSNIRKFILFSWHNENKVITPISMLHILKREDWGLSRIVHGKTTPFLRIDTNKKVYWEFPDEFSRIFDTKIRFIRNDTIFINSIDKSIPVYYFDYDDGSEENYCIYLDENFLFIGGHSPDYPSKYSNEIMLIDSIEVPDKFKISMDSVLLSYIK